MPPRRAIGRTQAARTPFAVLVIAMLVAGVVGLLMFNTNMQQASFKATALQEQVNTLTAKEQSLNMELDAAAQPAAAGGGGQEARHGRRPRSRPSSGSDGGVLGTPAPATSADSVRINRAADRRRRRSLKPQDRSSIKVPANDDDRPRGSQADTRGASTRCDGRGGGRKKNTNRIAAASSGATH